MALRPTLPDSSDPAAPKKDHQQDALLREVDDALREDEFHNSLKRYGKPLAAGIVLLLGAFAGYLWWKDSNAATVDQQSEQLALVLDKVEAGNGAQAGKELDALVAAGGGPAVTARLARAGAAQQQGRLEEAARDFAAVAADSDAPQPYRDLATVREVAIRYDKLTPQQVIDRLKPLAVPGNPWFGSAGEFTAMAHLRAGKKELAGPMFVAVAKDKDTPESLKSRARQMAGLLGYDAIDDVAKAAGIEDEEAADTSAAPTQQEAAKQ